jgi:multicomponent Na+:H+ antiporter subunit A
VALDFDAFAILLVLAPFLAATIAPVISRETGRAAGWILAIVPAGLFLAFLTLLPGVATGTPVSFAIAWVPALGLDLAFQVDGLALVFALLITGIGTFIVVYSSAYLGSHPHRGRFMAFLLLFTGSMLGIVLSDSMVALFCFWELTTDTSFLLIGFEHDRVAARRAAVQALVITGLGGLSLMAGGTLMWVVTDTWQISALAGAPGLGHAGAAYPWALGFFIVAAFTKSAQLPFHFWLPSAMQAPIPVSAFLHSATMVQAGIYLLARLAPLLSGGEAWHVVLGCVGAATSLWGAIHALGETDLKQILAQTTVASLGLLVALLGVGGEAAALAVAGYFVAHALYKAALFLVAGMIDRGTGTRDITRLGGLRDQLTISFISSALAGASMFGVPPLLGWFAKEEIYAAIVPESFWAIALLAMLVIGNALLGAVALTLALRPFMGALKPTAEAPREGGFALWIGPALFGLLSLAVVFGLGAFGQQIVAPMASSIAGYPVESHLSLDLDIGGLPFWLSVATWGLAGLVYWRLDRLRDLLVTARRRFAWTFDRGFDEVISGLLRLSGFWTRAAHHGRLELYLVVVFATVALVVAVPLVSLGAMPQWRWSAVPRPLEWGAAALAIAGLAGTVLAPTRLGAVLALGIQGLALALIFILFGAPDLGFTQLLIEVLSVVILALVMARLRLSVRDPRPLEDWLRDGFLAVVCGVSIALLLVRVLQGVFDGRLSEFFARNSVAIAVGRNFVNVILVDFRGLDTLGEIVVVMTAGVAVLALLRRQHKRGADAAPAVVLPGNVPAEVKP